MKIMIKHIPLCASIAPAVAPVIPPVAPPASDTATGDLFGPIPDAPATPLESVAAQINAAHCDAQAYASKAVERALVAGDLLNTVKAQLRHGEFLPWCKEHCPDINPRTLQSYMRVARELPIEMRSASHLSVREALRLVAGDDESTVIDVTPEPTPPWWETQTAELNCAFCADGDLFGIACVWMDTAGVGHADIAARLGMPDDAVTRVLYPQLPNDLYMGAGQEVDAATAAEFWAFWARIVRRAEHNLMHLAELNYSHAARYAKECGHDALAAQLDGVATMHRNRRGNALVDDDYLVQAVAVRLMIVSMNPRRVMLPAAWLEIGATGINAIPPKKAPRWLNMYIRAAMVWMNCAETMDMSKAIDKPLHLAAIAGFGVGKSKNKGTEATS